MLNPHEKTILLAPASSREGAIAAYDAGADACYMGVRNWSLRPPLFEMELEEAFATVDEATSREKEIYLAVNCMYPSSDLEPLLSLIEKMVARGISAVIMSDPGFIRETVKKFPSLPVHASVQASITNLEAARFYRNLGVSKIVLARNPVDLSPETIRELAREQGLGIELFIIGDNSRNFDGRCFLSSYFNQIITTDSEGRPLYTGNANRSGYCYLMCKRHWRLIERSNITAHSPAEKNETATFTFRSGQKSGERELCCGLILREPDLIGFELLPLYWRAGVRTFKIQGREYPPELIKEIVTIYRKLLDITMSTPPEKEVILPEEAREKLVKLFRIRRLLMNHHLKHLAKTPNSFWRRISKIIEKPVDRAIIRASRKSDLALTVLERFFENVRF